MKDVIERFDRYLAERQIRFHSIVIGGGALIIMGVISRRTRDIDCLDPIIPESIKQAALDFREANPSLQLWEKWLNNGPISLAVDLPEGWRDRLMPLFEGEAISLQTLGRLDFLVTKLFALCDRQQDYDDCIALAPTAQELDQCLAWLYDRDGNPYWPDNVRLSLKNLAKALGYEYLPAN